MSLVGGPTVALWYYLGSKRGYVGICFCTVGRFVCYVTQRLIIAKLNVFPRAFLSFKRSEVIDIFNFLCADAERLDFSQSPSYKWKNFARASATRLHEKKKLTPRSCKHFRRKAVEGLCRGF